MTATIGDVSFRQLSELCRKYRIRRLALFGSALREDFDERSDVDVLVEFESGHVPGLAFFEIEQELADLFGRRVDLNTPGFLSSLFLDEVLDSAVDLYVAT